MRTRAERISNTNNKINKRKNLAKAYGFQQGTIFKIHINKINKSMGYMRTGNVSHFVSVGYKIKTKDRKRYGKVKYLSIRDLKAKTNQEIQLGDL